jgi:hypothetical protein
VELNKSPKQLRRDHTVLFQRGDRMSRMIGRSGERRAICTNAAAANTEA